jgi:hypothetical protein
VRQNTVLTEISAPEFRPMTPGSDHTFPLGSSVPFGFAWRP